MTKKYHDFDKIYPGLYQGSYPGSDQELFNRFDVIVYSAKERPPRFKGSPPPGKQVISIPLDDDPYQPLAWSDQKKLTLHARSLAQKVREGKEVLVTCAMGYNRSGLISALTLMALTGCHGKTAINTVRERRRRSDDGHSALFNPIFERFVLTASPF